jgi:light-regulated signal transduction histidine kinase (bacteriophytochrome)
MDMKTPLRILHLEDDPLDAQLVQATLTAAGLLPQITRVATQKDYAAQLDLGGFDLILSDYTIPSFNGLAALKMAATQRAEVPFIFVSGTLGEEVAIDSLKLGATDYVLKNRLTRLGSAVERALRELEERRQRQRAEQQLRELNNELEQRVRDRTAQLEATSKELESFTQSVSHDLLAPIRRIALCQEMLMENLSGTLDAENRESLQLIGEFAQQMNRMVLALLELTRIVKTDLDAQPVDLSNLAESILTKLGAAAPDRAVQWSVQPRLLPRANDSLLRVALENLLGNAWKFTSKTKTARIEVGAQTDQPEVVYFIRDNGAGFDMAYADKLFTPFWRFHSQTEFPGLGVGLAMVQRIIHRHGGRIWAESAVDNGASFFFSLPASQPVA